MSAKKIVIVIVSAACLLLELSLAANHYKEFLPKWFVDSDPQRSMVMLLAAMLIWTVITSSEGNSSDKSDQTLGTNKFESNATGNVVHVYPHPPAAPIQKLSQGPRTAVKKRKPNIKVIRYKTTKVRDEYATGDLIEQTEKQAEENQDDSFTAFVVELRNERIGTEDFEVVDWHSVKARIRFLDLKGTEVAHTSASKWIDDSRAEIELTLFEVEKLLVAMNLRGTWTAIQYDSLVPLPMRGLKAEITLYGKGEYIFSFHADLELESGLFGHIEDDSPY